MLTVYYGPMFSEKTESLQSCGRRELVAERGVLAFKHKSDNARYVVGSLCTHDKRTFPAIAVENSDEIFENIKRYVRENKIRDLSRLAILIDEAQFFDDEISKLCLSLKPHSNVYVSFLDKNYLGQWFKHPNSERTVRELIFMADREVHLKAVCNYKEKGKADPCGKEAVYSQMVDPATKEIILDGKIWERNKDGGEKSVIKVGGKEWYKPRCEEHFIFPPNFQKIDDRFSIDNIFDSQNQPAAE